MKTNLNQYILPNKIYLANVWNKLGFSKESYEDFLRDSDCESFLAPYLFTLESLSPKDRRAFEIFYANYLARSGLLDGSVPEDLLAFVASDRVFELTFVATAQYYFL